MIDVENAIFSFLDKLQSKNILVINTAVTNEVRIPINKVVAKPLIGPVPNKNKINAVINVVTLASTIDDIAPFQVYA